MHAKILLVDDEENVLHAIRRNLQHRFNLSTATQGEAALDMLRDKGPFAVLISDLRMPGMDGVRFLSLVREQYPATVRMMLTGHADLQTAIEAVNEGNIFRLLTKPCPPDTMAKALAAGLEQYRLAQAEKELLEKTLHGGVKVLADVLALTNPTAFGRATRLTRLTRLVALELQVENMWEVEMAAMLSQIGCVTVPENVLQKDFQRQPLTADECQLLESHPQVGHDLIVNIPRLEHVAEIIARQRQSFNPAMPENSPAGARILKVVADFDTLISNGLAGREALGELRRAGPVYAPEVLRALDDTLLRLEAGARFVMREVTVRDLRPGMIFAEDVFTKHEVLLIARGQDVTTPIVLRLRNFVGNAAVSEPFRMLVSRE